MGESARPDRFPLEYIILATQQVMSCAQKLRSWARAGDVL